MVGVYPGFEGFALLLPTNRLRGFVAFLLEDAVEGPATSTIVVDEAEMEVEEELVLVVRLLRELKYSQPGHRLLCPCHCLLDHWQFAGLHEAGAEWRWEWR